MKRKIDIANILGIEIYISADQVANEIVSQFSDKDIIKFVKYIDKRSESSDVTEELSRYFSKQVTTLNN